MTPKAHKRKHPILFFLTQLLSLILIIAVLCIGTVFTVNLYMMSTTDNNLWQPNKLDNTQADFILVLGAGITNGQPSAVLQSRLDTAIELYQRKASPDILISGGGDATVNEISVMRDYLLAHQIPAQAITEDNKGIDTYHSITNAQSIFGAENLIIVSQRFHLYRAVYIAEQLGLDTYGCPCDNDHPIKDKALLLREFFARLKDFTQVQITQLPEPIAQKAQYLYQIFYHWADTHPNLYNQFQ